MHSEDGQVYSVCVMDVCVLLQFSCFTKYINKQHVNIADETLTDYSFRSVGINILNNLFKKDDIEFVTEFPCLLGHPVQSKHPIPGVLFRILILFFRFYIILLSLIFKSSL